MTSKAIKFIVALDYMSERADQPQLLFIPTSEIIKAQEATSNDITTIQILADILRLNALSMIMETGSGHPGTCLSSADIVAVLYYKKLLDQDIFFSSKGHDAPLIYSVLVATGRLPEDSLHKLRRLNGLPGHPDIHTPGIPTNTGSLGMGISKAIGMIEAKRLQGKGGLAYVLMGDGELQEGQNWEAFRYAGQHKLREIVAIIDHNKMQSDTWVEKVGDLGYLEAKFRSFGWTVAKCDGNDIKKLLEVFEYFKQIELVVDNPKVIIADTLKGAGVSFMESVQFAPEEELYPFHSGAPSLEQYQIAVDELRKRINLRLARLDRDPIQLVSTEIPHRAVLKNPQCLIKAYGDHLANLARYNPEIVVLDADLRKDHNLDPFIKIAPDRFIEVGIAEQNMVSMAGGLALEGFLPITHTFAAFQMRALEQMYNNATERRKIIYVGSLAGLLPGGPGHSHQAVMDIASFRAIPNLTLIEPSSEEEVRMALSWAVNENPQSTYLRLVSIPVETPYELPLGYELTVGRGVTLVEGKDAALIAYGPSMLTEAVKAAILLRNERKGSLAVINLPWLNRIDENWLIDLLKKYRKIYTLDDHYIHGGQGELIASILATHTKDYDRVINLGVNGIPACGQNIEVLKYHRLDSKSLAQDLRVL